MNKISAVVIAKNEEKMIPECLESVSFCDEIIVVDGGSTDKTVEIAKRSMAIIVKCENEDFSEKRNFGLKKADGDWILYVDADERVSAELASEIKEMIQKTDFDVFKLKRKNFYLGTHEWPYVEKLERLFRRGSLIKWQGILHESPIYKGKIGELNNFLYHYTHRTLSEMVEKTIKWSTFEAKLRYEANHPRMTVWRFPKICFLAFYNSFVKQKGWRLGTAGLIESIYQSFSMFITYAKLWEMQNSGNENNTK